MKAPKETAAAKKPFRHLITSDPADHLGRQKQALELRSIIDLSECIHIGYSHFSLCSLPQISTQAMALPELTSPTSKDPKHLINRSGTVCEMNSTIAM